MAKKGGMFLMKNTIRFLCIIAMAAVIGFSMAACDKGDDCGCEENSNGVGDNVVPNTPPSGSSIGCSSLSAGTACHAQSVCSGRFLCQTGQGSDSNCTTGCTCQ